MTRRRLSRRAMRGGYTLNSMQLQDGIYLSVTVDAAAHCRLLYIENAKVAGIRNVAISLHDLVSETEKKC